MQLGALAPGSQTKRSWNYGRMFWSMSVFLTRWIFKITHTSDRSSPVPENILSSTTGGGSTGRRSACAKNSQHIIIYRGNIIYILTFCSHSTSSCSHRLLQNCQLVPQNGAASQQPISHSSGFGHIVNLCSAHICVYAMAVSPSRSHEVEYHFSDVKKVNAR